MFLCVALKNNQIPPRVFVFVFWLLCLFFLIKKACVHGLHASPINASFNTVYPNRDNRRWHDECPSAHMLCIIHMLIWKSRCERIIMSLWFGLVSSNVCICCKKFSGPVHIGPCPITTLSEDIGIWEKRWRNNDDTKACMHEWISRNMRRDEEITMMQHVWLGGWPSILEGTQRCSTKGGNLILSATIFW